MERKNFIFQAWKVMNFNSNSANGMHFGGHQSLCLLNCLRSKNMLKQRKVLKIFKSDS